MRQADVALWAVVLLGCSDAERRATPAGADTGTLVDLEGLVAELEAPGSFQVGYRTVGVAWTDPLLTDDVPRELRVSLWYPTEATNGEDVRYQDVFPADGVLGGAPLAGETLPVAVFSHGHQAYGEAASFLMEHLASHGWVVAAPDHPGDLLWDGGDRATEIYLQRPLDVVAVLDWLDDPAGDELAGRLGPGRLGLGHSFGGYTLHAMAGATFDGEVVAGCDDGTPFCSTMTPDLEARFAQGEVDTRFDALVAMDPGDHRLFGAGLADVQVPELYMSADFGDDELAESLPFWTDLDHPGDAWGAFPGLGHNGFTDVAAALDPPGVEPAEDGWRVIRSAVIAWGRMQVLGDPEASMLYQPGSPLENEHLGMQYR